MSDSKQTLIEEGTEFNGKIASKCPVVVRGKVSGEMSAPALTITSTGAISGKVKAGKLESEGSLSGDIQADEVRLAGSVKSDTVIRTKALEVKLNATDEQLMVTFGRCTLEVGDNPQPRNSGASPSQPPPSGGMQTGSNGGGMKAKGKKHG